jgi:hypothetical protein
MGTGYWCELRFEGSAGNARGHAEGTEEGIAIAENGTRGRGAAAA